MKIAIYSAHPFEEEYIKQVNTDQHDLLFIEETLTENTVGKAEGCEAVLLFSSDKASQPVLEKLADLGIKYLSTRSAGTDHIDLKAAKELGIPVAHVPEYSPNAIAEHCIALTLAVLRKLKPSFGRIHNYNFSLEGQVGHEINTKTAGICGTGDIGAILANLFHCFGAKVLLFDAKENLDLSEKPWATYVDKERLLTECDIVSLNLPLNEDTKYFISEDELRIMKKTAILINTGRGEVLDTEAVRKALLEGKIAGLAMDVYENEKGIFYQNLEDSDDKDELLLSLIEMENVVVTAHQAFLTDTALTNMMATTFDNMRNFENGTSSEDLVKE